MVSSFLAGRIGEDCQLDSYASETEGYSGSDLRLVCGGGHAARAATRISTGGDGKSVEAASRARLPEVERLMGANRVTHDDMTLAMKGTKPSPHDAVQSAGRGRRTSGRRKFCGRLFWGRVPSVPRRVDGVGAVQCRVLGRRCRPHESTPRGRKAIDPDASRAPGYDERARTPPAKRNDRALASVLPQYLNGARRRLAAVVTPPPPRARAASGLTLRRRRR